VSTYYAAVRLKLHNLTVTLTSDLWSVIDALVFVRFFVAELGTRTKQTDRHTDGQTYGQDPQCALLGSVLYVCVV